MTTNVIQKRTQKQQQQQFIASSIKYITIHKYTYSVRKRIKRSLGKGGKGRLSCDQADAIKRDLQVVAFNHSVFVIEVKFLQNLHRKHGAHDTQVARGNVDLINEMLTELVPGQVQGNQLHRSDYDDQFDQINLHHVN